MWVLWGWVWLWRWGWLLLSLLVLSLSLAVGSLVGLGLKWGLLLFVGSWWVRLRLRVWGRV